MYGNSKVPLVMIPNDTRTLSVVIHPKTAIYNLENV